MSQSPGLKWPVAALFVGIVALLLATLRIECDVPIDENDRRLSSDSAETEDLDDRVAALDPSIEPATSPESSAQPCLTLEQLESHPILFQDAHRFDPVVDSGPVIAAYRGLSENELKDLAVQGDSAAMVVLGAMSVMRARDWPVGKAVAFLMLEDPELMAYTYTRPLSAEFINHTKQAREWFYQAALHGRVMVLHRVGWALSLEYGGPVELGWISEDEYYDLSNRERMALDPSNVYTVLAYEIAPGLKSGPHGEMLSALIPRIEQQQAVLNRLAEEFDRGRKAAGLPPIIVPESDLPSLDELRSLLCDGDLNSLEEARETTDR